MTASVIFTCDHCGVNFNGASKFRERLSVKHIQGDLFRYRPTEPESSFTEDLDFCSLTCLAEWTEKKKAKKNEQG